MRKTRVYMFELAGMETAGKVAGFNLDDARKMLRTIFNLRALPPGSIVFPEKNTVVS
jgi:hypothetical protein